MQMRLGEVLRVTLTGSSHGPYVGATVEGMPSGIDVDESLVAEAMALRKTGGTYSSKRNETDVVDWCKGVDQGARHTLLGTHQLAHVGTCFALQLFGA